MGATFFAGTDPVSVRIRESASRGTLSHALLFTGPGDRLSAARYAAAALECEGEGSRPCGVCAACRKVAEDIHPDVITVRDDEHKNVAVEIVRRIRADAYVRPNEGRRKVYIFPDCSILTEQDQNVLLKIVEEGPPYAAFLFCGENSAAVLQTLRSRCMELKLTPHGAEEAQLSENGRELCLAIANGRRGAVTKLAVTLERRRTDRESLGTMLEDGVAVFTAALLRQYGKEPEEEHRELVAIAAKNLTKRQIMRTIDVLQMYRRECVYNVGTGHVLGALAVELEGIL